MSPLTSTAIDRLRNPKETLYFAISAVFGGLIWFIIAVALLYNVSFSLVFYIALYVAIIFLSFVMYEANVLGNAVLVTSSQFPLINNLVSECSESIGVTKPPKVFVISGSGVLNAFAVKLLGNTYIILHAEVVDFALGRNKIDELKFIILHELSHHAAGHTLWWKSLLLLPSHGIPFLYSAYSRAREYTCDSIAANRMENKEACLGSLLMLAHGSKTLADDVSVKAFLEQDEKMNPFGAVLNEILSSHPRLTRRVKEIRDNQ
jgi:Zn-dependent protease with chaperone function